MDSTPVNWETLDSLIVDFAKSENLIEDSFASSPPSSPSSSCSLSSSTYQARLLIRQIRRSLETGDIDAGIDLLRLHAPFVLDDHRILFRLQKQKFIELLRRGTLEDRDAAIHCLRTALAPCALDSYPEAYEEFKHVLLAFIYDKDDLASPVASEWSERRRFEIAGLMSSILRAHLQAYDPIFSMALRYLISIHKAFCFRQGTSSPISDLSNRLLLEDRDLPATPQESLYEAPPFDEVDIQALAHAVELTRQGAIDSLRFAKGDLFQAFQVSYLEINRVNVIIEIVCALVEVQNELCRMKLDISLLDDLVREYCIYRGIVDSIFVSPDNQTVPETLKGNEPEPGCCSSRNCSLEMDCITSKLSDGETSVSNAQVSGSPELNADATSKQGAEVELRYANEPTVTSEDCSTSGSIQLGNLRVLQRNRTPGTGEGGKRKRWRGRHDDVFPDVSSNCFRQELGPPNVAVSKVISLEQDVEKASIETESTGRDGKYAIVLGMKELTCRGMTMEVIEEINALDPNFFTHNHILLFQLKQVEFLKLVGSGDYSSALRVACSHLGPLASSDPTLLKPLKETLLALLRPNIDALEKGLPLHALATSLQVAVGRRLGIEEPQLMKIIRTTIHSHSEWFKLQMCKDRFESLLKIDSLKEVSPALLATATLKLNFDSCTHGSSQVTSSSGVRVLEDGSPAQVSSRDIVSDENAILKVMEFLALPRADAIHLLAQYNGNAEMVIQQIFA